MPAPTPTRRLEDDYRDELRKWRENGGTLEQFRVFWPLIRDKRLSERRRAA